jgi:hypothetical protein
LTEENGNDNKDNNLDGLSWWRMTSGVVGVASSVEGSAEGNPANEPLTLLTTIPDIRKHGIAVELHEEPLMVEPDTAAVKALSEDLAWEHSKILAHSAHANFPDPSWEASWHEINSEYQSIRGVSCALRYLATSLLMRLMDEGMLVALEGSADQKNADRRLSDLTRIIEETVWFAAGAPIDYLENDQDWGLRSAETKKVYSRHQEAPEIDDEAPPAAP